MEVSEEKNNIPLGVSEGPLLGSLAHIDQRERGGNCMEGLCMG